MSQIVNVEVLYSFALSTGNELLLETTRDQHEGLAVLVDARMSPSIELPPLRDAAHSAIRVSWSEHEEWELWEISWFTVRIALTAQRAASANDVVEGIPETTKRAASAAAVRAASHFLRLVRWRCGQFWLPTELKVSGLVYLVEGERVGSQGFLEAGTASRDRALSVNALRVLATDLASGHEPELHEDFLLFAQNYRRQGDLRAAMSFAAISLEASMTKLIRKRLAASAAASSSQVDRFIENMSSRSLATVVLGLLEVGDAEFRQTCAEVFETRNRLFHGKRSTSPRGEEVNKAIDVAGQMGAAALAPA